MISVEEMLIRLAARGLVPCEHSITIWQFADGSGQWGVAVEAPYTRCRTKACGATVKDALANLMRAMNRGADLDAATPSLQNSTTPVPAQP